MHLASHAGALKAVLGVEAVSCWLSLAPHTEPGLALPILPAIPGAHLCIHLSLLLGRRGERVRVRVRARVGPLTAVRMAGPGFLAHIPRPQPKSASAYLMNRHLHYVSYLFVCVCVCVLYMCVCVCMYRMCVCMCRMCVVYSVCVYVGVYVCVYVLVVCVCMCVCFGIPHES